MYSDNDFLNYENKPIKERFTTPLFNDPANIHVKSTVKGNLKINYWKNMNNPHSSVVILQGTLLILNYILIFLLIMKMQFLGIMQLKLLKNIVLK